MWLKSNETDVTPKVGHLGVIQLAVIHPEDTRHCL